MKEDLNFGDHVRLKALDFSLEMPRSLIFASVTIMSGLIVLLGGQHKLTESWTLWAVICAFGFSILLSFFDITVTHKLANEGKVESHSRYWLLLKLAPIVCFILGYGFSIAVVFERS